MTRFTVMRDFLPPETFNHTINYAMEKWKSGANTFKTNHHWQENIVMDSNIILAHEIEDITLKKNLTDALRRACDFKIIEELMIYYYSPGCHIPWHDDSHCRGTVTIYLNDKWDMNHGGLFLYNEGDGVRAMVPEKNMMVFQPGGIPHSVSVLSPRAPVRVTIQTFFDSKLRG